MKANVILELISERGVATHTTLLWQNPAIPVNGRSVCGDDYFIREQVGSLVYFIGSVVHHQICYDTSTHPDCK